MKLAVKSKVSQMIEGETTVLALILGRFILMMELMLLEFFSSVRLKRTFRAKKTARSLFYGRRPVVLLQSASGIVPLSCPLTGQGWI